MNKEVLDAKLAKFDEETLTLTELFNDPRFSDAEFKQILRDGGFKRKNAMRNKPCVCESGKKLKDCCWNRLPK